MTDSPTIRHCTFRVAGHCLAVEADAVAEVLGARPVTRVPLAPAGVLGLVQLRGRIVPILDPAVRLGLPAPPDRRAATLLVLRLAADEWFGLAVEEVLDVIDVPAAAIEHPTAADEPHGAFVGVFSTPDRLVHIVDHDRLIRLAGRQRPPAPVHPGVHS